MRVLLLNPASRNTFQMVGIIFPPLGVLYVAAAIRDRGYEVEVVDRVVTSPAIDYSAFDVVGIHSDTTRFNQAFELACLAKAAGARVVMGGPHPCFVAEDILSSGMVDAVVKGEGEETFPDLLDAWREGGDPDSIPGLILPTPQGLKDTGNRERIQDMDAVPFPARDLIDLSKYRLTRLGHRTVTPVHTSRGCPHACRFCSSTRFDGPKWRARSAENVLAELEYLVGHLGYRAVAFTDDNFTGSPERVHDICDGILKKGWDVHWWCFCRADTIVRYPDMLEHMAEAGAHSVFVGVETPSLGLLDRFHKGISPDQAEKAVDILKRNGLEIWASYILGSPQETRKDIRTTIRFARQLDTHTAQFTLLTPYPGTDIWEELKDQIGERWDKFDGVHAVYKHPRIPRTEMQMWLVWANMAFYFRNRRSVNGFRRFLSNRKYGAEIASQVFSSRNP